MVKINNIREWFHKKLKPIQTFWFKIWRMFR